MQWKKYGGSVNLDRPNFTRTCEHLPIIRLVGQVKKREINQKVLDVFHACKPTVIRTLYYLPLALSFHRNYNEPTAVNFLSLLYLTDYT